MDSENCEIYRDLCAQNQGFTIFQQAWWLDAVATNGWDVILIEHDGEIVGANAYLELSRFDYKITKMPLLTQHIGPWLSPKLTRETSQIDVLRKLAQQAKTVDWWSQNWPTKHINWLPFYWEGFKQTTRYTYRIEDPSNLDRIWANLSKPKRRDIRIALSDRYGITFDTHPDPDEFIELNRATFSRQGLTPPYSRDLVKRIIELTDKHDQSRIIIARDKHGCAHAGVLLVWDEETMYYIMGGSEPKFRKSQATSACLWEAICVASQLGLGFDFEGSMIEPIERYFRGFGGKLVPYHSVSRIGPTSLSLFALLRERRIDRARNT